MIRVVVWQKPKQHCNAIIFQLKNLKINIHDLKKKVQISNYKIIKRLVAQTVKSLPAMWETRFDLWVRKIPWRRKWQPTLVFLPRKSHG